MTLTSDEWVAMFQLLDRAPKSTAEALWIQSIAQRVNEELQREQLKSKLPMTPTS